MAFSVYSLMSFRQSYTETVKSSVLDKESVQRVTSVLLEAGSAVDDNPYTHMSTSFSVTDAFDIPRYRYDLIRKMFWEHTWRLSIHGDASAKARLYRDRFLLLCQRLSGIPQFSRPSFNSELFGLRSCEISQIQSLVGRTGISWVMGVISQFEDGHYYLEDLTSFAPAPVPLTCFFFICLIVLRLLSRC
ncbi:putative DNA-directed DNA polymerase [Helianthus annuus]|nr:putative DNA-directed DNA polymerase [Helianthus annuus]KAJ0799952.1 putative DNA-directed DNA polymerase [Helianthus annuus]